MFFPNLAYIQDKRIEHMWRNYEINETGFRDIFRSMDRCKLTFSILQSSLNIYTLSKERLGLVESFGPLHDFFELEKRPKLPLFQNIPEVAGSMQNHEQLKTFVTFL